MKKAKKTLHTPGPWNWDMSFGWLCSADKILVDLGSHSGATAEDRALIAAAPDLLEALEVVASDADGMVLLSWPAAEFVRATIAKARGSK